MRAETLLSCSLLYAQGLAQKTQQTLVQGTDRLCREKIPAGFLRWWQFYRVKRFRLCLSPDLCQEGKRTLLEAGQGWNSGTHDVSWHWLVAKVFQFFSFVSLTHLSVLSNFPCDFYSRVMFGNLPVHQPTCLLCVFNSADIYYADTYRRHSVKPGLRCLYESCSHATNCLHYLHGGKYASCILLYFAYVLIFFYLKCVIHKI